MGVEPVPGAQAVTCAAPARSARAWSPAVLALEGGAGLELLMDKIKTTKSNDEFLAEIAKTPSLPV